MPDLKEPVVSLENVKIRALHLTSLDLEAKIRVENNNPVSATVRELPFTIFFRFGNRQEEIASGNVANIEIPANVGTDITIPVTSYNLALIEALASILEKGDIQLEIKGTAVIDHILGWTLPFTKTVDITEHELTEALLGKNSGKQGS